MQSSLGPGRRRPAPVGPAAQSLHSGSLQATAPVTRRTRTRSTWSPTLTPEAQRGSGTCTSRPTGDPALPPRGAGAGLEAS